MDRKAGKYIPEFILNSRVAKKQKLVDTLTNLHNYVTKPQTEFGNAPLQDYLRQKYCKIWSKDDGFCSFWSCPEGILERKLNFILSIERLGFAWLEILAIVECQQKDTNQAAKLQCFEKDLPERKVIRDQAKAFLKLEEGLLIPFLAKLKADRTFCECKPGWITQDLNSTDSLSRPRFKCVDCPHGFYTLLPGAKKCLKCPEILDPRIPDQKQCIDERLKDIKDECDALDKVINAQTIELIDMKKVYKPKRLSSNCEGAKECQKTKSFRKCFAD